MFLGREGNSGSQPIIANIDPVNSTQSKIALVQTWTRLRPNKQDWVLLKPSKTTKSSQVWTKFTQWYFLKTKFTHWYFLQTKSWFFGPKFTLDVFYRTAWNSSMACSAKAFFYHNGYQIHSTINSLLKATHACLTLGLWSPFFTCSKGKSLPSTWVLSCSQRGAWCQHHLQLTELQHMGRHTWCHEASLMLLISFRFHEESCASCVQTLCCIWLTHLLGPAFCFINDKISKEGEKTAWLGCCTSPLLVENRFYGIMSTRERLHGSPLTQLAPRLIGIPAKSSTMSWHNQPFQLHARQLLQLPLPWCQKRISIIS